jgi:lysozyme
MLLKMPAVLVCAILLASIMSNGSGTDQSPAAPASKMTQAVTGIDVSHDQADVDWLAVRASGVTFAFAKATEGENEKDPRFAANWAAMRAAGVVRGAYHFFTPADDGTAQARHFLSVVTLSPGDLPPVVDVEVATGATPEQLVQRLGAWLALVEKQTGRIPIIYTSHAFWSTTMNASFGRYPLWVAEYEVEAPRLPTGWTAWTFWQHSDRGSVPGVRGDVDLSRFNGSAADLATFVK